MNLGHNAKLDGLSKSAVDVKYRWCSIKEEKYTDYRPIHIPSLRRGEVLERRHVSTGLYEPCLGTILGVQEARKTKEKTNVKIQQDRDKTRERRDKNISSIFFLIQAQELSSIASKIDLAIRQLSH